jgi:hypothetical protein
MKSMTHKFAPGDRVAFSCHIFGDVTGTIEKLMRCLSNGQPHAIVRISLPGSVYVDCSEPLINLRLI